MQIRSRIPEMLANVEHERAGLLVSTIDVMLWKLLAVWMSKTTQQLPEPFQVFSKTLKHTTVQHLLHIRCDIKTFVFKTAILCFSMLVFFFSFCKYFYNPVTFSYEEGVPQQMVWPTQRSNLTIFKSVWGSSIEELWILLKDTWNELA